jgi:hypothetical protein
MDSINLAQDEYQLHASVNKVLDDLRFSRR